MQFEGGLGVTAGVVDGIMRLSDQQGAKLIKDVSFDILAAFQFSCMLLMISYPCPDDVFDIHLMS